MKSTSVFGFLLGIFTLVSCEKETTLQVENEGIPLLAREIYTDDLYWEYTYTNANLLHEIKTKFCYTVYSYNDINLLTGYDIYEDTRIYSSDWATAESAMHRQEWVNPHNTPKSGQGIYFYNHGRLNKIVVTRPISSYESVSTFEYDTLGRIRKESFQDGFIEYLYSDHGNLIRQKQYFLVDGEFKLITMKEYEYDEQQNPFKAFNRLLRPGKYMNENNIVRETVTLFSGNADEVQVTESTYEYNEEGYPVKKDNMITYEYKWFFISFDIVFEY